MRCLNCIETRVCKQCGRSFTYNAIPSRKTGGLFCSGACQRKGRKQRQLQDSFNKRRGATTGNGCVLWNGAIRNNGYGCLGIHSAHRLSYEFAVGPVPDGMHILHKCDNRLCINPEHLFPGTNSDNITDKLSKGRQAKGEMFNRKLTNDDVQSIRKAYRGGAAQKELARKFNVHQSHVSRIVQYKVWR
jgi:hypothetical protein